MNLRLPVSEQQAYQLFCLTLALELVLVILFLGHVFFADPNSFSYKFFHLDREKNIPTLFSTTQLFAVGVVLIIISTNEDSTRKTLQRFFLIGGLGFIFLAFDEAFSIHESISKNFKAVEWIPRFKGNHGLWVIPYLVVLCLTALLSLRPLNIIWKHHRKEALIIGIGGIIFLTGAVGLEVLSYQFLRDDSATQRLYLAEVTLEELFEMLGISFVLYGSLLLLNRRTNQPKHSAEI